MFSVEVQIYTVEGFLRTVHSRHYASHQRLKLRQFLIALLPSLFPREIYGDTAIDPLPQEPRARGRGDGRGYDGGLTPSDRLPPLL